MRRAVYFIFLSVLTLAGALELIRYDAQNQQEVSSDLGTYPLFTCSGVGSARKCETDQTAMMPYAAGVALYGGINFIGLVLLLLFILFYVIFKVLRFCCWLCIKPCFRCLCGKLCGTCCHDNKEEETKVKDLTTYTKTDRYRIACFTLAILGITIMFTLGTLLGNYKVSENSTGFVDAPVGFQNVLQGMVNPASNVIINTAAIVMAPLFAGLNYTMGQAISLPEVVEALDILNDSKPLYPSQEIIFDTLYKVADLTTSGAEPYFNTLYANLSNIEADVDLSFYYVDLLLQDVDTTTAASGDLNEAIDNLNSTLYSFNDLMVTLVGSSDGSSTGGLVKESDDALTAVQRQPDGNVPTTDEFDATVTGSSGTLPRLVDGSMEFDAPEITQLYARLHWIYTNMSLLPDYASVADDLDDLNQTITDSLHPTTGLVANMTNALTQLDSAIDGFPNLLNVSDHLTGLLDTVRGIDFDSVINVLEDMVDDMFEPALNYVDVVYNETKKIKNVVGSVVPALKLLRNQVNRINATLVDIRSDSVMDSLAEFDEKCNETYVNDQVDDVLEQIDEALLNITDYREQGDEYLADARNYSSTILDAIDSFNFTQIIDSLESGQEFLEDVDINSTISATSLFGEALANVSITKDLTDSLRSFQSSVDAMNALLRRVAANETSDYSVLALGVCSNSASTSCTADGDCGAGTCTFGKYRCTTSGTACTDDSDCAASERCLADSSTASSLSGYMTSFADDSSDIDVSGVLGPLKQTEALNDVDLDFAIDGINDASNSLNAFNLTEIREYLAEINSSVSFNVTEQIGDPVRDIQETLIDLDLRDRIAEYDYTNFTWQRYLIEYIESAQAIKDFMTEDQNLAAVLRNFSSSTLLAVRAQRGHKAVIKHLAATIDWCSQYFHDHITFTTVDETHYADDIGDQMIYNWLDKASGCVECGYGDITSNGATYYLMRMFDQSTVHADNPKLMGIVASSDHERYEDDKYCTTSGCEEHTMGVLNTEPMSEWEAEFPGYPLFTLFSGIDYTREQVMIFLWLPILLTVFIGIITAWLNFKTQSKWGRRVCTSCMMTCTLCNLFFIMLFTALLFPMVLVFQDVCDSGANIGSSYIIAYGDDMCANGFGGTGTLRNCQLSADAGVTNVTFNVDIVSMYDGVFKQQCGATDPFKSILYDVAGQITTVPTENVNKTVDDELKERDDYVVRENVVNLFRDAGSNAGVLMSTFLTDLADSSLNCENLASILGGMKGSTCGSFVAPSLWIIGSWYLAGWMLFCCMFPAGCCGKNYYMVDKEDDEGEEGEEGVEGELVEDEVLAITVDSPPQSRVEGRDEEGGYHAAAGEEEGDFELPEVSAEKAKEFESAARGHRFMPAPKKINTTIHNSGPNAFAVVASPHFPSPGYSAVQGDGDEVDGDTML